MLVLEQVLELVLFTSGAGCDGVFAGAAVASPRACSGGESSFTSFKSSLKHSRALEAWPCARRIIHTDLHNFAQVVDISKLFNPQSYLTAIKQICCQNVGLELDKLQAPV